MQAAIVREQVTAFGGQVRKSLGDGFLISFPAAAEAVRSAAAIQKALGEHSTADPQGALEIRIGIHIGQVTERDGDLLGQHPPQQARPLQLLRQPRRLSMITRRSYRVSSPSAMLTCSFCD